MVPATLGGLALGSADRFMVQIDLGQAPVAQYQVAYNIGALPMLALGALTTVWMPRFFAIEDDAQRTAVLAASRVALNRLLAPVVVGMSLACPLVLRLWAPPGFHPDDLVLVTVLVILSAVPYTAVQSATRDLLSRSATRSVAWATVLAALANIGLNIVLIPALGLTGAAVATFLSYGVQHGFLLISTGLPHPAPGQSRWGPAYVVVGAALALASTLIPLSVWGLLLRGGLALVCLACFGWLLRGLFATAPAPGTAVEGTGTA
jgi:O-antigen/teichoic acid export membrane protein